MKLWSCSKSKLSDQGGNAYSSGLERALNAWIPQFAGGRARDGAPVRQYRATVQDVTGTWFALTGIGNEVYQLRHPEIGRLRQATTPDTVDSITLLQTLNPEGDEHLDTPNRLIRANSAVQVEGVLVGQERDGRCCKAEWVALPEVSLLTEVAPRVARGPTSGLVVVVAARSQHCEGWMSGSPARTAVVMADGFACPAPAARRKEPEM